MPRHNTNEVDRFFDYGVHVPTRTLYMGSIPNDHEDDPGTNWQMAEYAIKGLHILDSLSDSPINIIMNNPGGDEYHCAAIYDAIKNCRSRIVGKVFGHAMSAGAIILQACDERLVAKSAKIMVHYGTWFAAEDHPKNVYRKAEEGKRFDLWMEKIFYDRMKEKNAKVTKKEVKELCLFDTYLTAVQTVRKGLADDVIEDKV